MAGGIPITDPVELAWCEFARKLEQLGFSVENREQGVSIASFKAGAEWASARIREELLAEFAEAGWIERHSSDMRAIIDRIVPETGRVVRIKVPVVEAEVRTYTATISEEEVRGMD